MKDSKATRRGNGGQQGKSAIKRATLDERRKMNGVREGEITSIFARLRDK